MLTAQQELFCREYVAAKFNGSAAYRAAYPKVKSDATARANAARLLANANIDARWKEIAKQAAADEAVTPQMVLRELKFIAFQRGSQVRRADGSLKEPSEWDEATDATIAGMKVDEELVAAGGPDEQQEPQPHGGSLKRSKAQLKLVRTTEVKRWDKGQALKLFMQHFGLLKEAAPHPDRPKLDLTKIPDELKHAFLAALRASNPAG